jgi:hypothetical protein
LTIPGFYGSGITYNSFATKGIVCPFTHSVEDQNRVTKSGFVSRNIPEFLVLTKRSYSNSGTMCYLQVPVNIGTFYPIALIEKIANRKLENTVFYLH